MKTNRKLVPLSMLALSLIVQSAVAQEPIPLASEPHHHLVLHNDYVNIFDAKAAPGDSLLLHRHDRDAIAIAIGDQIVTVGGPGRADVHQKNADGQVRMQASGYVHSTHVDSNTPYYTVAIELLRPQTSARNLCALVLAGQPLHCQVSAQQSTAEAASRSPEPQFESDQTHAELVRVPPHQNATIAPSSRPELIILLDSASASSGSGASNGANETLQAGKFIWIEKNGSPRLLHNHADKELRYIEITFEPIVP